MENQTQPVAQPELSVSDLQNVRILIDTAVRRGAFNASELSSVGAVFDKLNSFLNAVTPASPDNSSKSE